jgi:RNA polymerase sigma factor (TIGR02999 family)
LLLPSTRPKTASRRCHDFQFFSRADGLEGGVMTENDNGGPAADMQRAAELLPVVYAELRRLAVAMSGGLPPGQTLQPTALVHEAYVRLVGDTDPGWNGRRHFFGAAARAMRDILVEQARHKGALKRGGGARRVALAEGLAVIEPPAEDVLAVDDAIQQLHAEKPHLAEIAMLRYFAGLSTDETAAVLGISARTLAREWRFARAWLVRRLGHGEAPSDAGPGPAHA